MAGLFKNAALLALIVPNMLDLSAFSSYATGVPVLGAVSEPGCSGRHLGWAREDSDEGWVGGTRHATRRTP